MTVRDPSPAAAQRIDLFRRHRDEYRASIKGPALVDVGPAAYLAIDASTEDATRPGPDLRGLAPLLAEALAVKERCRARGSDFVLSKFEARGAEPSWTLLLRVPDFVVAADVEDARIRLLELPEGRALQSLLVGSWGERAGTLEALAACARSAGLETDPDVHLVWLVDPRRAEPAALKTIVRLAVRR